MSATTTAGGFNQEFNQHQVGQVGDTLPEKSQQPTTF